MSKKFDKISKASEVVKEILEKDREIGGSNRRMQLNTWCEQDESLLTKSFVEFANEYAKKDSIFAEGECINRAKRTLQEKNEDLRDSGWLARHGKKEKEAIEDIKSVS